METNEFLRQRETFGLETDSPWALPALRLVFSASRTFEGLARAWNLHYPGTMRALTRLSELGFVDYQPGVVIDTFTGELAAQPSRKVERYRATASGLRALASFNEDLRNFEEVFPRTLPQTIHPVVALLDAFALEDSHARYGLSVNHATTLSGLPPRLARWWVARFKDRGWLTTLPERYADVREVVPPHWRVTRPLCRQLEVVLDAFPQAPQTLRAEFRLKRSRFLDDIDPSRVGVTGATDFDHDVTTQAVLATMMRSPLYAPEGLFRLEPRLSLPVNTGRTPWVFDQDAKGTVMYQPDAILTAQDHVGTKVANRRVVLEYERFQSRRDAWSHIERFLGWLHTRTLPFETANLCFVVDSDQRQRTYIQLIEAFSDHILDHPERAPANPVTLATTTVARLGASADPLSMRGWGHITLPTPGSDTEARPVLHDPDHSPYGEYFGQ